MLNWRSCVSEHLLEMSDVTTAETIPYIGDVQDRKVGERNTDAETESIHSEIEVARTITQNSDPLAMPQAQ